MAVTRIKNNQITDASAGNTQVGVNAAVKLQDYTVTATKIANNLVYGSDLTVSGNLTVQGNTTTIDTTITTIEDPVIVLASTQTSGAPTVDIGYLGYRGNQSNIAFVWDESADEFVTAFTSTGETNTTITITSYADFHTNNANIGGNLVVGGNISITGNVASLNVTGNITGGNLLTPGLISAAANVTGGNVLTGGAISATANVTGGNVLTGGAISATSTITSAANITGGNVLTGGLISATSTITSAANITGGNVLTGGLISATSTITSAANITGGNLLTGGLISATATITGGNLATGGTVSASGNVTGGNILFGSGIITGTGNIYGDSIIADDGFYGNLNLTGNITVNSLTSNTYITASGNISGNAILSAGLISAGGAVRAGANVDATGNVNAGNVNANGFVEGNIVVASSGEFGIGNGQTVLSLSNARAETVYIGAGLANLLYIGNSQSNTNFGGNIIVNGFSSATGNVTGGNLLTGGRVSATGDIFTAGNLSLSGNIVDSGALTITTGSGNLNLEPTGNIVLGNRYINGLQLTPQQDADAASKYYVDQLVTTAISYHDAVVAATTGNLDAATGGTVTYAQPNGVANGVGATLTTTGSFNLIDSANVQTVGTRILVKDQANAVQNGVYVYSNATVITRASTEDTYGPASANTLSINDYFFVSGGNVNLGSAWIVDAPAGTITFGTSNILFAQFSQSQVYSANTSAGLSLIGQTFSAKVDNNTTAFDLNGNISVKAGANLTTPNIGAATGTSLSVTGTVTAASTVGGVITGSSVSVTGTATAASTVGGVITGSSVSVTGTATAASTVGGVITGSSASLSGNVTGGNVLTGGLISATSTITSAANITGGNLLTGGLISATSNITGGNLLFGSGIVSGTGNIYANNIFANISGNIDAGGANTQIQFNDNDLLAGSPGFTFDKTSNAVTANGNITGSNFSTAGVVTATGNITGGNVLTGGLISATSTITSAANVTGGNLLTGGLISATSTITSAANITGGNLLTGGLISATSTITSAANITGGNVLTGGVISATGNITGGNLILAGAALDTTAGRLTVNSTSADADFAVNGDTVANVLYIDAGTGTASFGSSTQTTNAVVAFNATNSVLMPVGNTAQRPATGVTGMLRFNTTDNNLEIYNNSQWEAVGVPAFTVIADEQFNGDGSTVAFTLSTSQTTNSCIVSINGVVQVPTVAYSVSTTTLTFTEAPAAGDLIDVRQITTTTTVTAISNGSGNAVVEVLGNADTVQITGNLLPITANSKSLGSSSKPWKSLYVSGNTIYLGTLQLTQLDASTFAVYKADGITQANIDVGNVDVSSIISGTSTIGIYGGGQTYMSVNGNANVLVASNTSVLVNGAFSATGNITGNYLFGNGSQLTGIDATSIQSGTSNVRVVSSGGNVATGVGGTSNVVVVATTGQFVTGVVSATGNITGSFFIGNGSQLTGIDATSIQNGTSNVRVLTSNGNIAVNVAGNSIVSFTTAGIINNMGNGVGNIGNASGYFNTIFAKATSAQYADLAEKYTADADYAPGTVVMFGGAAEVTICSNDACRRVAGVISTNPSYIMNGALEGAHVATVALTGRVPCRVTGTVRKGDLMVSAGNGAARAEADPKVGTVIGKALADFDGTDGVIEVVVGRF